MNMGAISLVADCITAGATLGLFLVALCALNSWRDEMRAKPAAEMLASVYRLCRLLDHARKWNPVWSKPVTPEPGESDDNARHRSKILWPIEILTSDEANIFKDKFADRRYYFQALFGSQADRPIQKLQEIEEEILNAALNLIRIYRDVPLEPPPAQAQWESTIGLHPASGDDPIKRRLDEVVAEIERVCRPLLRTKKPRDNR